jgi:hypothetical protein
MNQPNVAESVSNQALTILASDVLAVRCKNILDQMAAAEWQPLADLRQALETYSELRLGTKLHDSEPPDDGPAPPTQRSVHS